MLLSTTFGLLAGPSTSGPISFVSRRAPGAITHAMHVSPPGPREISCGEKARLPKKSGERAGPEIVAKCIYSFSSVACTALPFRPK